MCPYARTAWRVQKHRLAAVPAELVAHDHASVSTAGLTSNVVFSRPVLATQSFPGPQSLMPLAVPSSLLLWPRTVEVVPVQVRQPSCTSPRPPRIFQDWSDHCHEHVPDKAICPTPVGWPLQDKGLVANALQDVTNMR